MDSKKEFKHFIPHPDEKFSPGGVSYHPRDYYELPPIASRPVDIRDTLDMDKFLEDIEGKATRLLCMIPYKQWMDCENRFQQGKTNPEKNCGGWAKEYWKCLQNNVSIS